MNTIRYLLGLFRAFPGTVASYFMSSQLGNIVAYLSGGYIARGFLNHLNGAPGPAFDLGPALVLLGLAQMVQLGTHVGWMYGSVRVSRFSMAMMSLNIMDRVLKRPGGLPLPVDRKKGRPLSEGQCLNTLSNDTIQLPGMFDFLFEVLSMLVSGVVAFWIMLRINSFVTLVVYLPLAFAFWLLNLLRKKVQPLADKARRSSGEVSTMIADMFNCIQTVKTSASERHFLAEFRRLNAKRLADSLRSEFFFTFLRGLNSGLLELSAGMILLSCAAFMQDGSFSVGDFMLFSSYLWAVMGIFRWGGMFMAEVKRNNVAIERMETLMHPEPPLAPVKKRHLSLAHPREIPLSIDRDSVEALERLEVRGLCFRYDSVKQEKAQEDGEPSEEAAELTETSRADEADRGSSGELPLPFGIEDISFSVEGGSLVVVTGQIGSGKTTLLKSVIGILPVQAGSVLWNGEEAPSGGKLERSRFWDAPRAAYTPQVPRLFSNTLRENVLLGIPEDKADLAAAIRDACLEADLAEMPAGLDTEIGPRGVRLSGGQVQRTAAARMFARGARLMVLDDISSALDVETEKTLWDRLLSSKGRATYLVASHREALLRRADTILLMHEGRLAAQGSFAELMLSSSLFRSLMKREQHPELN